VSSNTKSSSLGIMAMRYFSCYVGLLMNFREYRPMHTTRKLPASLLHCTCTDEYCGPALGVGVRHYWQHYSHSLIYPACNGVTKKVCIVLQDTALTSVLNECIHCRNDVWRQTQWHPSTYIHTYIHTFNSLKKTLKQ